MAVKKIMIISTIMILLFREINFAQPTIAEGFFGSQSYKYQHMFMRNFSQSSQLKFFNSSSLQVFYKDNVSEETMSQSYIMYGITPSILAGGGSFYATGVGFRPSVSLQFLLKKEDFFAIIFPRMDVWENPSYEVMMLFECRPKLKNNLHFYSRLNVMSNYGSTGHNRSFQNVVLGIDWKNLQIGIGWTMDEWGKEFKKQQNWGILLKKEFF